MKYYAREKVNMDRQPEIDCLKALCIFLMIIVHAYENCAEEPGWIFAIFRLGETLTGAASFMICMGLGMVYSKSLSPRMYAYRGFELLTISQLLNIIRDSIPSLIAWWITGEQIYIANVLVIQTDILTFAGFAYLLMGLLAYLRISDRWIVALGVAMNAAAFALSRVFRTTGNYALDQFLGFFVLTEAEAYFPLCSYFIFVAFGYALGRFYQRIQDKDGLSTRVLQIGLPAVVAYYVLRFLAPLPFLPPFNTLEQYVMNPLSDAWANCVMAICWMALFHKLLKYRGGKAPYIAMHFSLYVNSYYCISYVFFTPLETFMLVKWGRLMPGTLIPFLYGLLVIVACYFIIQWNEHRLHFSISRLRGRKRIAIFSIIWLLTLAIGMYSYPRTEVFATFWNDYLM